MYKINVVSSLKPIDASSRVDMINKVDGLAAEGGTCLDEGLLKGMEVLKNGGVEAGGVILFLTDGIQQYCDATTNQNGRPGWGPHGGIPGVIDTIANAGIRVVTIAFGYQHLGK